MSARARMYLATLEELPIGSHVAQAAHALTELAVAAPDALRAWHAGTNTVVCIAVTARTLAALADAAAAERCTTARFHEPDRGDELTAVAVLWPAEHDTPETTRILRRSRLTGPTALRRAGALPTKPVHPREAHSTRTPTNAPDAARRGSPL